MIIWSINVPFFECQTFDDIERIKKSTSSINAQVNLGSVPLAVMNMANL